MDDSKKDTLQPSSTPSFMGVLPGEIWRDAGMQMWCRFLVAGYIQYVRQNPKKGCANGEEFSIQEFSCSCH